jgi:ribose 5-phosphate isomerase B
MKQKIYLASDHAGVELKSFLIAQDVLSPYELIDLGPTSEDSVDYPDFAHPLAESITNNEGSLGILICGSGNGVCMTANKHKGIRAGLAWTEEIASLTRQHNNANVLCLPARFITQEKAVDIVKAYLNIEFEGGRHQRRVDKI